MIKIAEQGAAALNGGCHLAAHGPPLSYMAVPWASCGMCSTRAGRVFSAWTGAKQTRADLPLQQQQTGILGAQRGTESYQTPRI